MTRVALATLVLCACGGSAATAPHAQTAHATPPPTTATTDAPTPEHAPEICVRRPLAALLDCASLHEDLEPEEGWLAAMEAAYATVPRPSPPPASTHGRAGGRGGRAEPTVPEPRELAPSEISAVRAARHVLCAGGIGARPEVAYRAARIFYEAYELDDAATLFDSVVREAPSSDLSTYAAMLALDSLNVQLQRAGDDRAARARCLAAMKDDAAAYTTLLHCGVGGDEETCGQLELLRCDMLRVDADGLASGGDPAGASREYERIYATHCPSHADEALYNAAVLAHRAADAPRADALLAQLRAAFPTSPLAQRPLPDAQ